MPTKTPEVSGLYTTEQAANDIAELRGQIQILLEANTQLDTTTVINTPTGGHTQFSSSGHQKYTSSDGNAYNTGRTVAMATSDQPVGQTGNLSIPGTAIPVVAGTYLIRGVMILDNGSVTATQAMSITTAAVTNLNCEIAVFSATSNAFKAFGEITSATGQRVGTGNLSASERVIGYYFGSALFSAGGTVQMGASCVTSALDTFTVRSRTHLILEPVT